METVDIQAPELSEDTGTDSQAPQADTAQATPPIQDTNTTQLESPDESDDASLETKNRPPAPFANGKEKFKVNGQEFEWDWETTKRYAQLGRSGQLALERAAQTEKNAKRAYAELVQQAKADPEGLIRIFNPTWQPSNRAAQSMPPQGYGQGEQAESAQDFDPKEAMIRELEQKLSSVESRLEKQDLDQERKVIETELENAVKAFPVLDNEIHREYVKAQYARHLKNGLDNITIEDVAFHVSQQVQEMKEKEMKARKARLDDNRRRAPVSSVPGDVGKEAQPSSFDDVRRIAGLR